MNIIDILAIWCILLTVLCGVAYMWGIEGSALAKKHGLKVCWILLSLLCTSLTVFVIFATNSTYAR